MKALLKNWLRQTSVNERIGQLVVYAGLFFMAAMFIVNAPGHNAWIGYSLATLFIATPFVVMWRKYRN